MRWFFVAAGLLLACQRACVFWEAYGRRARALNTKSSRWMLEKCQDPAFREGMRLNRMEDVCGKVADLHGGPTPLAAGLRACVPAFDDWELPPELRLLCAFGAALGVPAAAAAMWRWWPSEDEAVPRALTLGAMEDQRPLEGWRAARRARHI